jgi:hypothetical protein
VYHTFGFYKINEFIFLVINIKNVIFITLLYEYSVDGLKLEKYW